MTIFHYVDIQARVLDYISLCGHTSTCTGLYFKDRKNIKNEQRSKDAAAKKIPNTSGVRKINNYYEDIYIPPYKNTDSPHLYIVTINIDSTH